MQSFISKLYYYDFCQAGCTWVTHSLTGERGDNPYCYYRAGKLRDAGLRETIVKTAEAPQTPFATGRFDIVVETLDGEPGPRAIADTAPRPIGATHLVVCEHCEQFIGDTEAVCVHCNTEQRSAARARLAQTQDITNLLAEIDSHAQRIHSILEDIGSR